MIKPFLRQVVDHYFASAETTLFVFPNRRSQIFFKKYFGEKMLEENVGASIPRLTTISDLFRSLYAQQGSLADELTLLVELYDVYREVRVSSGQTAESLDDFLFWGGVILGDFGDIDKYLADPSQILKNIAEYRNIAVDPKEFASEAQYDAICSLVRSLKGNDENFTKEYHKTFIAIWDLLLPLYETYNRSLKEKGLAYEGMIFRYIAEHSTESKVELQRLYPGAEKVVFVGLNALSKAELTFLRGLAREDGFAEFCWDFPTDPRYDSPLLSDPQNKASHFIRKYLEPGTGYLPQAFPVEYGPLPEISVISTSTTVAESKLIPSFLKNVEGTVDERTLVLLPDETQLQSVLTSIPTESVKVLNVTMGSPLSISGSYALFISILRLFEGRRPGRFYHREIWDIFSSTIFKRAHAENTDRICAIKDKAQTYIPSKDLEFSPVFRNLPDRNSLDEVIAYLLSTVEFLASKMDDDNLEREAMYEIYRVLNYLGTHELHSRYTDLRFDTFKRLLVKLLSTVSIPYHGEPLCGLQVMGPLEVRALDFENIMILSSSEGVFPRKNVADSFIPYTIRKAFDLPTYEEQDAIWAYYFYRLISRAKRVWMVYNSTADGLQSGEPSRYIMQLRYAYRDKLALKFFNHNVISSVSAGYNEYGNDNPYSGPFSASSVQKYLSCPLAFYYRYIGKIDDDDESVSEDVEGNQLGNIVHNTMEELYSPFIGRRITSADIESLDARPVLEKHLKAELNIDVIEGKPFIAFEQARQFVDEILEEDRIYAPFRILGLEQKIVAEFNGHHLSGTIDRIDLKNVSGEDVVRIVDYKTGRYYAEDIQPRDGVTVGKAFDNPDSGTWPKISIQLFIYDYLWESLRNEETRVYIKNTQGKNMESEERKKALLEHIDSKYRNSIYCPYMLNAQRNNGISDYASAKTHDGEFSAEAFEEYSARLESLLEEICDSGTIFRHRDGCRNCEYCKYETLCRK